MAVKKLLWRRGEYHMYLGMVPVSHTTHHVQTFSDCKSGWNIDQYTQVVWKGSNDLQYLLIDHGTLNCDLLNPEIDVCFVLGRCWVFITINALSTTWHHGKGQISWLNVSMTWNVWFPGKKNQTIFVRSRRATLSRTLTLPLSTFTNAVFVINLSFIQFFIFLNKQVTFQLGINIDKLQNMNIDNTCPGKYE